MITVIVVLAAIIAIAAYLTTALNKDTSTNNEEVQPYTKEELENIKLAEELYNKDLRPVVAKKAKIIQAPELEVVEPEFIAKETKPTKKKRKYYPKKK